MKAVERGWLEEEGRRLLGLGFFLFFSLLCFSSSSLGFSLFLVPPFFFVPPFFLVVPLSLLGLLGFYIGGEAMRAIG